MRAKRAALQAMALLLALNACRSSDCLTGVFPSVSLTVLDASTSENLADIATATLRQGNTSKPFQRSGDVLTAGENWAGDFRVEVTSPGYQSKSVTLEVRAGRCYVYTEDLIVELERRPGLRREVS